MRFDHRFTVALMLVMVVGGVVATLLAVDGVGSVLAGTSWPLAVGGLLVTVLAYAAIGSRFAALGRMAGLDTGSRMMTELGFVSTSVGRVMFGGGTAGNLMRIAILRRHGINAGETIAASLMHTLLNFVVVLGVFFAAIGLLMTTITVSTELTKVLIAAGSVTCFIVGGIAILLFSAPIRRMVVSTVVGVGRRVARRDLAEDGANFISAADAAFRNVRSRPRTLAMVAGFVVLEALAAMTVLWFTFAALGTDAGPHVLVAGFGIGSAAAMASMLPGGLGVQEGSMAAIFALFGIDLETAVAGAILFRVLYFFVPFGVSLLFYKRLMSRRNATNTIPHVEVKPLGP